MISENKLKHMRAVAEKCEALAKEKGLSIAEQNACFVMGLLHDIGYAHCDETTNHPEQSYIMLVGAIQNSHNILPAIRYHGRKYENLTVFDEILNLADLTTNYDGNDVTIEERLQSIAEHHGKESEHYQHAIEQAAALKKE